MSKKRFLYNPIYIKKYEKNDSYCRVHKNFQQGYTYFFNKMYDAFCVATRFFSIILHFLYHYEA